MDFSTAVGFIATSFPLTCMFLFGKYGIVEKTFGDYSLQRVEFHLVENSEISLCVYKALIFSDKWWASPLPVHIWNFN